MKVRFYLGASEFRRSLRGPLISQSLFIKGRGPRGVIDAIYADISSLVNYTAGIKYTNPDHNLDFDYFITFLSLSVSFLS